jgi:hypothetical protein
VEPEQALQGTPGGPDSLAELVRAVVATAGDRVRHEVGGVAYVVEEVTWPVSANEDGSSAFACPHTAFTLVREGAVLLDVRRDYWDGNAWYRVVGDRLGRWMRFRIGSPGERGWDLHLATEAERQAFAGESAAVIEAFSPSA